MNDQEMKEFEQFQAAKKNKATRDAWLGGMVTATVVWGLVVLVGWNFMNGRIQGLEAERVSAAADRERIQQLQAELAALQKKQVAQGQPSPLELLNVIHPGLGTLAVAADKAIKQDQAKRAVVAAQQPPLQSISCGPDQVLAMGECITCNPGLHPGTFANGDVGCVQ